MAKPTIKKPVAQNTTPAPEVEIDKTVVGDTTAEETAGVEELNEELGDGGEQTEETKTTAAEESKPEEAPAEKKPEVQVDTTTLNEKNKPMENVKIRMAKDHSCVIAMERYDLKAGKTYVVPRNVRNILNRNGLLKPL